VAANVAPLLPAGAALCCSPLSRCVDLAQTLAELRPDLPVAVRDPRIAEMDFGEWEGQLWSGIGRTALDAWASGFADTRAGRNGESTRQFLRRVAAAFDAWRDGGRDAVWITHAGVIRAAWLLRDGIRSVEHADQWPRQPIAFGECMTIQC
jgi:alpha-ribazole phosphatase